MKVGNTEMPKRATKHSCGYDFHMPYDLEVKAGEEVMIDSEVSFEDGDLRDNQFMMLCPRSSLGMRYGMRFLNSVGIIDADYRDTIKAKIITEKDMSLKKGDRFMQGIIMTYDTLSFEIEPTEERVGGLGSTGR